MHVFSYLFFFLILVKSLSVFLTPTLSLKPHPFHISCLLSSIAEYGTFLRPFLQKRSLFFVAMPSFKQVLGVQTEDVTTPKAWFEGKVSIVEMGESTSSGVWKSSEQGEKVVR